MRFYEIINEYKEEPETKEEHKSREDMPHLFLDMDGVQADFFGAWSKLAGVKHWKFIKNHEAEIEKLANSSDKTVYDFFANLEPLSGGRMVINWLHKNKIPYTVLSAPLRGPYQEASVQAKKDWLAAHYPDSAANARFTSNKFKYAMEGGKPNVLVDDHGKYLGAWSGAGGIAVKHEDQYEDPNTGAHTIEKLEKIYAPYLNK